MQAELQRLRSCTNAKRPLNTGRLVGLIPSREPVPGVVARARLQPAGSRLPVRLRVLDRGNSGAKVVSSSRPSRLSNQERLFVAHLLTRVPDGILELVESLGGGGALPVRESVHDDNVRGGRDGSVRDLVDPHGPGVGGSDRDVGGFVGRLDHALDICWALVVRWDGRVVEHTVNLLCQTRGRDLLAVKRLGANIDTLEPL